MFEQESTRRGHAVQGRRQGRSGGPLTPMARQFSYFDHINVQKFGLRPPEKSDIYPSDPPWKKSWRRP